MGLRVHFTNVHLTNQNHVLSSTVVFLVPILFFCMGSIIQFLLEWNLLKKSVKRPFCCTVSILQVSFTYLCFINFGALKHHFIGSLKLILKENKIMK